MLEAYILAGLKEWQESLEKRRDSLIELNHKTMQEFELLKAKYEIASSACENADNPEIYYRLYVHAIETEMNAQKQMTTDTQAENKRAIEDLNRLIKEIEKTVDSHL
ncbi:hypothetical protein [Bacillus sp. 1P06AnD]|uniref:hypothetical protein n=1 Tax=Bacillus sp. 1P06AnD TaxID=3132208 RepID=UPI0039A15AF5